MKNASEGKPKKDALLDFLSELDKQVEQYSERRPVPGLVDVMSGLTVLYPTTIYETSGDDTSGVVGMLMPSGEFVAAAQPRTGGTARYWEYDETLRYEPVLDENGNRVEVDGPYGKRYLQVKGNSWTSGEVAWDGVVTGSVNAYGVDGDEIGPINRREWEPALTGDWQTTGELWKAIERGTSMLNGPRAGVTHVAFGSGREESAPYYPREEAA